MMADTKQVYIQCNLRNDATTTTNAESVYTLTNPTYSAMTGGKITQSKSETVF